MVFVDGFELGDEAGLVLRDRQQLAEDGILIAVVTVDLQSGESVAPPELVARGFLYDDEREQEVLDKARRGARRPARQARQGSQDGPPADQGRHQGDARRARLPRDAPAAADHAGRRRGLKRARSSRSATPRESPPARRTPRHGQHPHGTTRVHARQRARGAAGEAGPVARRPARGHPCNGRPRATAASSRRSPASRSPCSSPSSSISGGTAAPSAAGSAASSTWLVGLLAFVAPLLLVLRRVCPRRRGGAAARGAH